MKPQPSASNPGSVIKADKQTCKSCRAVLLPGLLFNGIVGSRTCACMYTKQSKPYRMVYRGIVQKFLLTLGLDSARISRGPSPSVRLGGFSGLLALLELGRATSTLAWVLVGFSLLQWLLLGNDILIFIGN